MCIVYADHAPFVDQTLQNEREKSNTLYLSNSDSVSQKHKCSENEAGIGSFCRIKSK